MGDKLKAQIFLQSLEKMLQSRLCGPSEMRSRITEIILTGKSDATKRHWANNPEAAFLNALVAPLISEHMQTVPGITKAEAQQSLLSDYWHSMPEYCSQSSARTKHHPFSKSMSGDNAQAIMERWRGISRKPLVQPYPDFAFRPPFPHKILIEGKYFSTGNAEKALVESIYEACFYRGLPFVPASNQKPAWDYDFACLIIYDASEDGSLLKAWDSVVVQNQFWETANVYVMVLGDNNVEVSIPSSITELPASFANHGAAAKVETPNADIIEVYLPGARDCGKVIITPPMEGRERWFDKRQLVEYNPHEDGGFVVKLPKMELVKRGLSFLAPDKI